MLGKHRKCWQVIAVSGLYLYQIYCNVQGGLAGRSAIFPKLKVLFHQYNSEQSLQVSQHDASHPAQSAQLVLPVESSSHSLISERSISSQQAACGSASFDH
jgi:hypothetical protein